MGCKCGHPKYYHNENNGKYGGCMDGCCDCKSYKKKNKSVSSRNVYYPCGRKNPCKKIIEEIKHGGTSSRKNCVP